MRVLMLHGLVLAMACLAALGAALVQAGQWLVAQGERLGYRYDFQLRLARLGRTVRRWRGGRG
jgi:hypothetical protein